MSLAADRRSVCVCVLESLCPFGIMISYGCFLNSGSCLCLIYYYPSTCSFRGFQFSSCLPAVFKGMSLMNQSMTRGGNRQHINRCIISSFNSLSLISTPTLYFYSNFCLVRYQKDGTRADQLIFVGILFCFTSFRLLG